MLDWNAKSMLLFLCILFVLKIRHSRGFEKLCFRFVKVFDLNGDEMYHINLDLWRYGLSRDESVCLYTNVAFLADSLERAGSADKDKLTAALGSSTFKAELMPYGPTKFVNGQNEGGKAAVLQANKGDIQVIAPEEFAEMKAVFPKPKF